MENKGIGRGDYRDGGGKKEALLSHKPGRGLWTSGSFHGAFFLYVALQLHTL